MALYDNDDATLDDLREAVTTLEDVERIARRVLGGRIRSQGAMRKPQERREPRSAPAKTPSPTSRRRSSTRPSPPPRRPSPPQRSRSGSGGTRSSGRARRTTQDRADAGRRSHWATHRPGAVADHGGAGVSILLWRSRSCPFASSTPAGPTENDAWTRQSTASR